MKNWLYIIYIGLFGALVSSCQQSLDDEVQTPQDSPRAANISMRLVLDEPFAALDEDLRHDLAEKLKGYLRARDASAILVTHNKEDAEQIADRILTLN